MVKVVTARCVIWVVRFAAPPGDDHGNKFMAFNCSVAEAREAVMKAGGYVGAIPNPVGLPEDIKDLLVPSVSLGVKTKAMLDAGFEFACLFIRENATSPNVANWIS